MRERERRDRENIERERDTDPLVCSPEELSGREIGFVAPEPRSELLRVEAAAGGVHSPTTATFRRVAMSARIRSTAPKEGRLAERCKQWNRERRERE